MLFGINSMQFILQFPVDVALQHSFYVVNYYVAVFEGIEIDFFECIVYYGQDDSIEFFLRQFSQFT